MCVFGYQPSSQQSELLEIYFYEAGKEMASIAAALEPGISAGSIPLADALVPASIFAPDRAGCGEDAGDDCSEDGDMMNGEPEERGVDFTNKVSEALRCAGAARLTLAAVSCSWGNE